MKNVVVSINGRGHRVVSVFSLLLLLSGCDWLLSEDKAGDFRCAGDGGESVFGDENGPLEKETACYNATQACSCACDGDDECLAQCFVEESSCLGLPPPDPCIIDESVCLYQIPVQEDAGDEVAACDAARTQCLMDTHPTCYPPFHECVQACGGAHDCWDGCTETYIGCEAALQP